MTEEQTSELIGIAEAAKRIGVPRPRFAQWVSWGTLGNEQGVRRLGKAIRIDWPVFQSAFEGWRLAHPTAWHSGDDTGQKAQARARSHAVKRYLDPVTENWREEVRMREQRNGIGPTSTVRQEKREPRSIAGEGRPKVEPQYITVNEAARRMSVHPDTIYAWIASGRIEPTQGVFHVGHRVRIDWDVFRKTVIESGRF